MKKRTICEAESVIKPYLKIVAHLLCGGKHAVDKLEQMPWSNHEHSKHYDYNYRNSYAFTTRWMGMRQSMAGANETAKV